MRLLHGHFRRPPQIRQALNPAIPRRRSRGSLAALLILLEFAATGVRGCATAAPPPHSAVAGAPAAPGVNLSGVWRGQSILIPCGWAAHSESICNAMNVITFTLTQSGSELGGHYACAYGNYICRHDGVDDAGYIASGHVHGRRLLMRVMIPADVSSCLFYGIFSAKRISGRYSCYEGGSVVEEGNWRVARID